MLGAILGGVSALAGVFQSIQGAQQSRDAQRALDALPVPELKNVAEGLQVSKMGNDLRVENAKGKFAQNVDTLSSGGIRGVIGGLSSVNSDFKQTDLEVAADYDQKQSQISQMIAEDAARIRAMEEERYKGNVAALSSQVSAGKQQMWSGVQGALQGAASGVQMEVQQNQFDKALDKGLVPPGFKSGQ
jgi:hypothetical protein